MAPYTERIDTDTDTEGIELGDTEGIDTQGIELGEVPCRLSIFLLGDRHLITLHRSFPPATAAVSSGASGSGDHD